MTATPSILIVTVACAALGVARAHAQHKPDAHGTGQHMEHRFDDAEKWAKEFDDPARDAWQMPGRVIDALGVKAGETVADIGAGTGYFSFRMARKLPKGKVLAVDIQPEMLDLLRAKAKELNVTNVQPVLGEITDPKLPESAVDVVLMVDAYHEFDQPREMMEAIVRALRPGGRVVLVEFRAEDPAVRIKPLHKMTEAQSVREMAAAGLRHVETKGMLPMQHLMIFEKPRR